MAEKTQHYSTAGRIERLESIKARLKSAEASTVAELASELGVSTRTLSRDLELLKEQGLPLETERGRGGGVRLHRHWGIGRVNFNFAEAVDLLITLAIAEQMRSPLFVANLPSLRRKLVASFAPDMKARVNGLKSRILIAPSASAAVLAAFKTPDVAVAKVLHQAFLLQQRLNISYRDEKGALSRRTIEIHFLVLSAPVWYLVAWDELRQAVRTFRCDRITSAQAQVDEFRLRPRSVFHEVLAGIDAI